MAGPNAICPVHGLFEFSLFSQIMGFDSGTTVFKDCVVTCHHPGCGLYAPIVNGTYEFVGDVLRAFRAPDVSREDIEAFQNLVQEYQSGSINGSEVQELSSKINTSFARIISSANENSPLISLLVGIMALFLAAYNEYSSGATAERAHSDAQEQIAIQKKMFEALKQKPVLDSQTALRSSSKSATTKERQAQTQERTRPQNRHERRKAAKQKKTYLRP